MGANQVQASKCTDQSEAEELLFYGEYIFDPTTSKLLLPPI